MDRYDEQKDEPGDVRKDVEGGGRTGDVLGLSGSAVPKATTDPQASDDPEAARRRRARVMSPDDDPHVDREEPYRPEHGATGTQMGARREGTDIKP